LLMKEAYRICRLLSLDVVTGALIGAAIFSRVLRAEVQWSAYVLLAVAVWLIYTFDHLLDSLLASDEGRHFFYFKHRKSLIAIGLCFLVLACYLISLQPWEILKNGIFLSSLVCLHLVGAARVTFFKQYLKEFSCALLYTLGVALPAYSFAENVDVQFIALALFYMGSAWTNLLTISLYEVRYDIKSGFGSLVAAIGSKKVLRISTAIILLSALLLIVANIVVNFPLQLVMILLLMILTQLAILFADGLFSIRERYRIYGDLVYLLPVFLLI